MRKRQFSESQPESLTQMLVPIAYLATRLASHAMLVPSLLGCPLDLTFFCTYHLHPDSHLHLIDHSITKCLQVNRKLLFDI